MSEQPKPKAVRKPRVKKEVIEPIALIEDVDGIQKMPVILFATEPTTPVEKKPRAPRKPRITTPAAVAPVESPAPESPASPESPAPEAPESPAEEKPKKPRAPRKKKEVAAAAAAAAAAEPATELAAAPAEPAAEPAESSAAPEPLAALPEFVPTAIDCYCSGCRQTKAMDKFGLTKRGKTRKTCVECSERVRVTPPPYQYNRLKNKVVLPDNCSWENFGITWVLKLKTAPELALTLRDLLDALSPANMQAVEL